jgi:TonB family protein
MHFLHLLPILLVLVPATSTAQQREPIRVGSMVQESKLVHKVDPVYPAEAREARISGVVIVQVTVTESGNVSEVQILRGHPLLNRPAADAVSQWRYAPTLLNGVPVTVIASVTVEFSADGKPSMRLIMSEAGSLREIGTTLEGTAILEKVKETQARVAVLPNPLTPFESLEETLKALEAAGGTVRTDGPFVYAQRRLFYQPTGAPPGAPFVGVDAPEYVMDLARVAALARRTGADRFLIARPGMPGPALEIQLFVSETGELLGARMVNGAGPSAPELEAELLRTRIVAPGRREGRAVPVAVTVKVPIE